MHALQELPTVPSRPAAAASHLSWRRMLRCVIGAIGGVLWWGALLRLAIRPEAGGPWQSALAAGGWSLGLIPLHAVPARIRRPHRGDATAT
ncbi:hypothetical protein NMG29_15890 [Streptomyces cocklensis]|uniref:Uncharacterized protein n=1 Tax=Actinacidiphila cocklensis TaxID=887465 RepID=A0A9W4DNR4_9ACTN|nr:hypothetical protein [Actinacidiphila cocklensis]MDD1059673.1 hypothetical protein [Actinacidiphila cocklensis]CAG6392958.1 conserved hypothetical protein [Actinacidiphila cocklensis]